MASALAAAEPGFVALEGGDSRIEVVPTLGGRVRSLDLFDHEWLLPTSAHTLPKLNQAPMAAAGWDECAPSAGGGQVPEWVKGVGGRALPVGGEARGQVPVDRPLAALNTARASEGLAIRSTQLLTLLTAA
ncbi:MAG TPA: hypothetical protein PLY94_08245, partial [Gemmatimonadaceae bacterium]|nr:hypothetical protein [Gemmatimonadaceae bacterium]